MIRVLEHDDGLRVDADLRPGTAAFVDSEWLVAGAESVPALVTDPGGGRISFDGGDAVEIPAGVPPEVAAGIALREVAAAAVAAVLGVTASERVEVAGEGVVAACARTLLRTRAAPPASDARPEAIIDTTGDPAAIADATRRLAPLGTLVLAGELVGRRLALDLYPDVHARGLRVVGAPRPLREPLQLEGTALPALLRDTLADVSSRETFAPRSARWYRIVPPG